MDGLEKLHDFFRWISLIYKWDLLDLEMILPDLKMIRIRCKGLWLWYRLTTAQRAYIARQRPDLVPKSIKLA